MDIIGDLASSIDFVSRRYKLLADNSDVMRTHTGRVEYRYILCEQPSKLTFLVLHGAGGDFSQGILLAKPLIEKGLGNVLVVSRPGYIRTQSRDMSLEGQASLLVAL